MAAKERQPIVTPDLLGDPRILQPPEQRARMERAPFRAVMALPLLVQERMVGVLVLGDRVGRVFSDEEIRLAQAFADQAAQAIWNARLFAETERREREARALFEVTRRLAATLDPVEILDIVVEGTVQAMGSHAAAFYRWEPAQDSLLVERAYNFPAGLTASLRLRSGEGVAGRAHAEQRCAGPTTVSRRRRSTTLRRAPRRSIKTPWAAPISPRPSCSAAVSTAC
jgi:GAF domain-containing protein